jgi:hypothetical protein
MFDGAKTQAEAGRAEAFDPESGPGPINWPPEDDVDGGDADFGAGLVDADPAGAPEIDAPLLELARTKPEGIPYFSYALLFLVAAAASALVVLAFG